MSTFQIVSIIFGFLASGTIGAVVVGFFNRGITKANAEDIVVKKFINLNSDVLDQLKESRAEADQLRKDIRNLYQRIGEMEERDEAKEIALKAKNIKITELEGRIDFLESELKKYKPIDEVIESVANAAHTKIDEAKDEIKSNLTH